MNIYRDRNNKMNAQDVLSFYKPALHNNKNWLESARTYKDTEEISRFEAFIDRAETEIEFAEQRLRGECHCNAEHAHMTYIPHDEDCPAKYPAILPVDSARST